MSHSSDKMSLSFFGALYPDSKEIDLTRSLYGVSEYLWTIGMRSQVADVWNQICRDTGIQLSDKGLYFRHQPSTPCGRPDLELGDHQTRIFVEAKLRTKVQPGQLTGYDKALSSSVRRNKGIVLITRSGDELAPTDFTHVFAEVRWQTVADAFNAIANDVEPQDSEISFLIRQLSLFIQENGMSDTKVSQRWDESCVQQLHDQLQQLSAWANVLGQAAQKSKYKLDEPDYVGLFDIRREWAALGHYLNSEAYWVGVFLSRPEPYLEVLNNGAHDLGYENIDDLITVARRLFEGVKVAEGEAVGIPLEVPSSFFGLEFGAQVELLRERISLTIKQLKEF